MKYKKRQQKLLSKLNVSISRLERAAGRGRGKETRIRKALGYNG